MRARGSRVLAWGLGVGGGNNKVTFDFAEGPVISTPREKGGNKWYSCRGVWRQRGGESSGTPPPPRDLDPPGEGESSGTPPV